MSLSKKLTRNLITKLLVVGIWLLAFSLSSLGAADGIAQINPGWSEPVNLSKTGFTDNPALVFDSNGLYHVIWMDEFAGIVYVTGDGATWSVPEVVVLPSGDIIPSLVADRNGIVHAFWRAAEGELFHSRVAAGGISSFSSWSGPFQLDESVLSFDTSIDDVGDLHLSYIRNEESAGFPAGVYYRQLRSESNSWTSPVSLYFSHYLRSTDLDKSNVDVSTGSVNDQVSVYVAWDNFQRGRIYFARSSDGGEIWSDPFEVDKPDNLTGTSSTNNIKVSASDQHVLLIWKRTDAGGNCSQYYQWSSNSGGAWSRPQEMLETTSGCGVEDQLIKKNDGQTILWTVLQNQVNLIAWDQQRWSDPQVQHELSAIEDPETLSLVSLSCRQPLLNSDNLAVVGCDGGLGGDIWFMNRELSDISQWYSSPSDWSAPEELINSQLGITTPLLVAGEDELLHVLWSQEVLSAVGDNSSSIYYMVWDGDRWSQPLAAFQSIEGNASQPSAALDDFGRLLVVWSDSQTGEILFSWANAERAGRLSEWAVPVPLPIFHPMSSSPNILVDDAGVIFVVYAVPINEGRGIYLTSSTDGGETWSSPVQVFNGANSDWQIIDGPQLIQTTDGDLHTLWVHKSLPGNDGTLGLYYANSKDGGSSWSEFEQVVEGNVNWSQITSDPQGTVYRIWQEEVNNQTIIRYQLSMQNEQGWSIPESLSSFGESLRIARLVVDQSGQLRLMQIVQDLSGRLILRHWLWEEGRWVVSENSELAYAPAADVNSLAAAVSSEDDLNIVYSISTESNFSESMLNSLFFTNRSLELPASALTPGQSFTPVPTNTPIITASPTTELVVTPQPEPTSTPDLNALDLVDTGASSGNSSSGLIIGGVLAGLIVISVIGYGVIRIRRA